MTDGTDLYQRTLAFDYADKERADLMRKVWSVTPFMVDCLTGGPNDDSFRRIMQWCRDNIGAEAWPIHGREGEWQSGSATVFGWTWMGFRTEEQLDRFRVAFPQETVGQQP